MGSLGFDAPVAGVVFLGTSKGTTKKNVTEIFVTETLNRQ
jgi:hypothetical protein